MWPWGACWLQDEAYQGIVSTANKIQLMRGLGVPAGCRRGGHKKPLMCGLGVAVGCRMKHAMGALATNIYGGR